MNAHEHYSAKVQDASPYNDAQAQVQAHFRQVFATLTSAPDEALVETWDEFVEQWNDCVEVLTFTDRARCHLSYDGRGDKA